MPRRKGDIRLLSPEEITRRERREKRRLREAFKRPKLRLWRGYMDIGMTRLTEKGAMARTIARHLRKRGITSVPDLADKIYLDPSDETLSYLCLPAAFRSPISLSYLLALCGLEWDRKTNSYKPTDYERLE